MTQDHLDRYHDIAEYGEAKARIFMNQRKEDFLVLNFDDPIVKSYARRDPGDGDPFFPSAAVQSGRLRSRRLSGCSTDSASSHVGRDPDQGRAQSRERPCRRGAVALCAGADSESVAAVLREFPGLEHRLEFVREKDGVTYINDSKGTNVGAVVKSVEGFTQPVILIAGGLDKGSDFSPLYELFKQKVKLLILIGKAADKMAQGARHGDGDRARRNARRRP